jgi:DNA-binding winged helix-turn-helix (wHTH) protein
MLTRTIGAVEPISLAHVLPFRLGEVEVFPATRQLIRGGRSETLEPRVMQVLVALAEAKGSVLTRDELIERCWEGRIVSENAINRVISRLRQVAAQFGMDSFQLETITKVGYRMIVAGAAEPAAPPSIAAPARSEMPRRRLFAGAAVVAAAAAGLAWLRPFGDGAGSSSPLALAMYERGLQARNQGWIELADQAQAYFRQAVEADPEFAEAWAALALSYAGRSRREEGNLKESFAARARSAAERAAVLDPTLLEAKTALVIIPPFFRRWAAAETGIRQLLEDRPDQRFAQWFLNLHLGLLLGSVGRRSDALIPLRRAAELNPYHPGTSASLSWGLWAVGRLTEAEAESERAIARWPKHPGVWFNRMALLTYSGRPAAALAFASDKANNPFPDSDGIIARRMATARALNTRDAADIERAAAIHLDDVARSLRGVHSAVRLFAALGRTDTAFALCDAYFFNTGPYAVSAAGRIIDPDTEFLFLPPLGPMHADPRFMRLTHALGLEGYWRQTGTCPDYRVKA